MSEASLLEKVESYVRNLFAIHMQPYLVYHNLHHTENVVKHTAILSEYYNLNANNHFIIMTAAWFHDTGHLFGDIENHEARSGEIMQNFLKDSIPPHYLNNIYETIMATKMPVHPNNVLDMIICDADTWHLGTDDFKHEDEKVWQEVEARKGKTFENKLAMSLKFIQQHMFFTSYCISQLSAGKRKNIIWLTEAAGQ